MVHDVVQPPEEEEPPSIWISEHFTPYDVYQHGVKEILVTKRTRYQSMIIADTGAYGRALFLDSRIQTTQHDEKFYHEPLVHAPCLLSDTVPQSVLILGGADGGAAREALRWKSVEKVVVVDIDGDVVDECRKHLADINGGCWDDVRCTLVVGDALDYIANSQDEKFDVIISDLTDPIENSAILQLFSVEHFAKVSARLKPTGVLSLQGGAISLIESTLFPRIIKTLQQVFSNVMPAQIFVPTYGSPLALAIASNSTKNNNFATADQINMRLAKELSSELQVIDGRGIHGMLAVPKPISKAIADPHLQPFTSANIPHPNGS